MSEEFTGLEIAIVGMAGKFPGAETIEEFWQLLKEGKEAIRFFTEEELQEAGVDAQLIKDPNYVPARGIIKDEDKFDASFFDFFPREAEVMDPQHRLFLEIAWHALEDAGYTAETFEGLIGVFAGVSMNTYIYSYLLNRKGNISGAEGYQLSIGNDKDFLTTRVSYKLGLTGPSVDVQTACSTSLVATHIACLNLLNYNCDMALAGGVSITIPQKQGYLYQEGMILSKDGHCRAFDAKASGTVSGNGAGIVVLKRLEDALKDGDHIYAIIKGSAFNNDGANRIGYTAPSVDGQSQVIANAQIVANVTPETITYIETHGTGTSLGDPIEIKALTQVFREQTDRKQFCAIGSVKTNIGHLDAAAGVAGLIKATLALHHKQIPPSLHFEKPNPQIDFENSPFYVNTKLRDWQTENGAPRRAGVSSFGIGGTNVHAVLEEAPQVRPSDPARPYQLLLFSAKSKEALDRLTQKYVEFFKNNPQVNLADVAYTLQTGRTPLLKRRALVCQSVQQALEILETKDAKRLMTLGHEKQPEEPPVVFMFSGQGSQYVNMGRELYEHETVFKQAVDACADILQPIIGLDLREILYPAPEKSAWAQEQINQTQFTQPTLFVVEYALARLWMHWGVEPAAMVGHSIGEYVAAHLAGVFSLKDALFVVAHRGRLMQSVKPGAMISVQLNESDVQPFLNEQVSLAALNAPGVTVLSGPFEAIEKIEKQLKEKSVAFRRLHTSHAFHSAMMDPILDEFRKTVSSITLNAPQLPYVSNVSGGWISVEEATDPDYYARQLRNGVRFMDNLSALIRELNPVLLEVGPGTALSTLARRHPDKQLNTTILASMRHPREETSDVAFILNTVGRLWLSGKFIDWKNYYGDERRLKLSLPRYPFERKRYWLDIKGGLGSMAAAQETDELQKLPMEKWFYVPSWQQKAMPRKKPALPEEQNWLILKDDTGLARNFVDFILKESLPLNLTTVEPGTAFHDLGENKFAMPIDHKESFEKLFEQLKANDRLPQHIVHCWNINASSQSSDILDEAFISGYLSLLYLVQTLQKVGMTQPLTLTIVTNHLFQVTGYDAYAPLKAIILGLSKVIPQEFPNISCKIIDLKLPHDVFGSLAPMSQNLIQEVFAHTDDPVVAFRARDRWTLEFRRIELPQSNPLHGYLKNKGRYLITGGLGRIGLRLAHYLARQVKARLALLEVADFPQETSWAQWLAEHDENDAISQKIKTLQTIKENGSEILIIKADITDAASVQQAVAKAEERFGGLDGVIHAAGLVGEQAFKPIPELTGEDLQAQLGPKLVGALNLRHALHQKTLDFVLLQSSVSAILGGYGFGAYAAANAGLDALVYLQNQDSNSNWLSVNWDGWNFDETMPSANQAQMEVARLALTPEEGLAAFERIFANPGFGQLIVSTGDLHQRIARWVKGVQKEETDGDKEKAMHDRPELPYEFVAPQNELQEEIAAVWRKLLGIQNIGINDNFFDLGGNSLMGTQLISELRAKFQVELPLRALFEDATISGVAKIIEQETAQKESAPIDQVENLLEQLKSMSDEQAAELLRQKKNKDDQE
ncbi:type I polyketide synthase [Calditrichota bacterium LG25]